MQIQPYLFFNGRTEEALEFYREVLGAEILMKMRFKDAPSSPPGPKPPADAVMHACVRIGDSEVMGETFFAKAFGAVADKFGVSWMVIAGQKNTAPPQ